MDCHSSTGICTSLSSFIPFLFNPSCPAQASSGTLSEKRVAVDKGASDFLPRRSLKRRRVSALKLSLSSRLSLLRTPPLSNGPSPPFFFINIQSISPISKRGIHLFQTVMTIRDRVTSACARETNTPFTTGLFEVEGKPKIVCKHAVRPIKWTGRAPRGSRRGRLQNTCVKREREATSAGEINPNQ